MEVNLTTGMSLKKAEDFLISNKLLVHFESNKEVTIAWDASSSGQGAMLSHIMEDIAFQMW